MSDLLKEMAVEKIGDFAEKCAGGLMGVKEKKKDDAGFDVTDVLSFGKDKKDEDGGGGGAAGDFAADRFKSCTGGDKDEDEDGGGGGAAVFKGLKSLF